MTKTTNRRTGRPTTYRTEYVRQAEKLCKLGATDHEIAEFFGIHEATLYRWKHQHPDFCEAIKVGKGPANERVVSSLYRRAIGYSYDAVKLFFDDGKVIEHEVVEHVPPNVTAGIFWLKNREPETWRDKRELDINDRKRDRFDLTDEELEELALERLGESEG